MHSISANAFEDLSPERLRLRKSEKWAAYPPDVLPAFVAEMDFDLAPPVRDALQRAIDLGDCGYAGIAEIAPAFKGFASAYFNWKVEERHIFAVPDVMAGVTESFYVLTQPGAKIAINPPVYPPFFEAIRAAGREIAEVPLREDDERGWIFDFDALEAAFASGARAFLLCSPHNPVGRVWSADELKRIAELARAYGVAVISDEIHAPLTMPGVEYVPFLSVADGEQPCTAVTSASKAWNIAGLKCALAVTGSERVREALRERVRANPTEIRDRIGHLGAISNVAAFRDGGEWLNALRSQLDRNRHLLKSLLQEHVPGARYRLPEASYLAWVDCTELGLGPNPAAEILERGRVALEAGYKFGRQGERYVRINMGTSSAILTEIVTRMAAALSPGHGRKERTYHGRE
jgi:cystathionine beta-lyase